MRFTRRTFLRYTLAALGAAALPATAADLVEGRDYVLIQPPQPGAVPGKIQVLEFFSYGCPHCGEFHPLVKEWAAKLPENVAFQRVPVSFGRAAWANLARLYYALENTGDLARLDDAVFHAIHRERVRLQTDKAIIAWVESQGVDAKRFAAAYDSFGIQTKLARDQQLVRTHKVQMVPLLTVDGRYAVTGQAAKHYGEILVIADGLIARGAGG
jgi:thiol:disulfide interchange protein DsbA